MYDREANKVADKLVNEGVSSPVGDILIKAHQSPTPPLLLHCMEFHSETLLPLDGVTYRHDKNLEVNTPSHQPPLSVPSACIACT
jgi:hypothetical protein